MREKWVMLDLLTALRDAGRVDTYEWIAPAFDEKGPGYARACAVIKQLNGVPAAPKATMPSLLKAKGKPVQIAVTGYAVTTFEIRVYEFARDAGLQGAMDADEVRAYTLLDTLFNYETNRLSLPADPALARIVLDTLTDMSNSEDAIAEDKDRSVEGKRHARSAAQGLATIGLKVAKAYEAAGINPYVAPAEPVAPKPATFLQGGKSRDSIRDLPFGSAIPWEIAYRAFTGTSHSPERRAATAIKEYSNHLVSMQKKLPAEGDFDAYRNGYSRRYLSWLGTRSGVVSTMITGRSGFNVGRAQKKSDSADRRWQELSDWHDAFMKRQKREDDAAYLEARGGVIGDLEKQLAEREKRQALMKAVNRIAKRKKGTKEEKVAELMRTFDWKESTALAVMKAERGYSLGFQSFELTNNNANIKRIKQRLVDERAKEVRQGRDEYTVDLSGLDGWPDATVTYNTDEDRIQIVFAERLPKDDWLKFKGRGFRAKRDGTIQRQLTENGIYALRQLIDVQDERLPRLSDLDRRDT